MSASLIYLPAEVLVARVMSRVEKQNECWIFTGAVNSKGYGCIGSGRKGKNVLTHRLVVLHRDGALPADMTVDHKCEVKRCVNPDHLQVVTRAQNTRLRFTRHVPPPIPFDGPSFDIRAVMAELVKSSGGAA